VEREDAGTTRGPVPGRKQDRRRLPLELTGLLERKFEQGLDHMVRRRILRALHSSKDALSPAQLTAQGGALSDVPLSTVAYHVTVLTKYEMIRLDRAEDSHGALEHFFVSEMSADPLVLSVLAQTEGLDAPKRAGGGKG
jgi:DNA-binding transcriptional ArsR family regulator